MADTEPCFLTLEQIAAKIRHKEVSPVEVMQAVLERIEQMDDKACAFLAVHREQALAAAKAAEQSLSRGERTGPLHGVPFGLKDIFAVAGQRVTCGSKILAEHHTAEDATVVARLKAAGAIFVGPLKLHEFACGGALNPHYGPSHNPWHLEHITGGSSSGSGAAVAAAMVYGALGTDTGGSIRSPASYCGIVGLKQTYGRVSRHGVITLSWSLDHAGPMTRTVADAAVVLGVIAGHDAKDPTTRRIPVPDYRQALTGDVRGLRLGIPREYFFDVLDSEVERAVKQAIASLEGLGMDVTEVSIPTLRQVPAAHNAIMLSEAASFHEPWLRTRPQDYDPVVLERLLQGQCVTAAQYLQAQRIRSQLVRDVTEAMARVDVLVTPTSATVAPRLGEKEVLVRGEKVSVLRLAGLLTRPFNLTGQPSISVPCGFTASRLPIGLQITGKPFAEATVLRVAHAYEAHTEWHRQRPPIS